MSKFLLQKKELLEKVYKKAKNSTTETSFSGILKDLENTLIDEFNIQLSYRTFETYYKSVAENNIDYNIKPLILNDLSKYLGYENFKNFC
jgi:predicted HAD superfamily phosphohydrolase YqeG